MANDKPAHTAQSQQTPHRDGDFEVAVRVSERYGDCVEDFLGALFQRRKEALRVIGSFIEMAKLDHSYRTPNGTFRVWKLGQHRTLYNVDSPYPRRIAFLLPDGAVCRIKDSDEYVDVAYALANRVRELKAEADAIIAKRFVSDWARRVSAVLNVGDILVYEGEQGRETLTARFVLSQNGAGKEISVSLPVFVGQGTSLSNEPTFRLSSAKPQQERNLFRFLSHARPVSPPALVAAVAERPALTL
jgi:hypothetical protein